MKKYLLLIPLLFMFTMTVDAATDSEIETMLNTLINKIEILENNTFLAEHPIGSVYITTNSSESTAEKMSALYGGTWEAYGTGKTLVGFDSSNTNFSAVNKTGGISTQSITLTTANLPSHAHTVTVSGTVTSTFTGSSATTSSNGSHSHTISMKVSNSEASGYAMCYGVTNMGFTNRVYVTGSSSISTAAAHTHTVTPTGTVTSTFKGSSATTSSVGSSSPISVDTLQPYTTVYMWKRVS